MYVCSYHSLYNIMDLLQTIAASRMLRRRIPQSGHLMTAKRFWLQTVPCNVSTSS